MPRPAVTPRRRSRREAGPSEDDLDLLRLDRQRHPPLGPHFEARSNGFTNVLDGFYTGGALRNAAWNAGALRHPNAVFILHERYNKFHCITNMIAAWGTYE